MSRTPAERWAALELPVAGSFVDGRPLPGGGEPLEVLHPGDGSVVTVIEQSTNGQLELAVAGALKAQRDWAATSPHERARILLAAADLIAADVDRLAGLVAIDNGKTLAEARGDALVAAAHLRSAAGWASTLEGSSLPADGTTLRIALREPVGLVAAVIPFNAGLMFSAQKAGPALAAGNAIVLKAPELSPLAAPMLAAVLDRAGLPPGLLQVLQGDGSVGQALVRHPDVTMVSFTGSTAVGQQVMRDSADSMKRLLLELGGKSANIVYADADLDAAAGAAVDGIFRNAGQRCFSGSRLLVEDSVADEVIARVVEIADRIRVGDPFDPDSQLGCVISRAHEERIDGQVRAAVGAGARLLSGGQRPAQAHPDGAFYRPTVLDIPDDTDPLPALVRQEVFGPVLTVQRFSGQDQAVAIANDSEFGLVGGCWTADLNRALETARGVRSGYFWINSYGALGLDAPIGGVGLSGIGRELGRLGHEAYTELKTVVIDTAPARQPRWY